MHAKVFSIQILLYIYIYISQIPPKGLHFSAFINPRRACAERVTVVILCVYVCVCVCVCVYVCMYVCHAHAILAVRAIKNVTKDTVVLNVRFAAIL